MRSTAFEEARTQAEEWARSRVYAAAEEAALLWRFLLNLQIKEV